MEGASHDPAVAPDPGTAPGGSPPYPGLRPFERSEADLFFGRDYCLDGMAETLQRTHFLAVLGPSGSGKSSLVRSGLFMHLQAGMAPEAGSRWTFLDIKHPRTRPYDELARATLQAESRAPGADAAKPRSISPKAVKERSAELRKDPFALARWWGGREHHPNENLLLLVDQFEELFGYSQPRERDEVEAFVDLLIESARSAELDIYVVMTMRAEFLGGCALFPGLAEQINQSLSLTPRMTREECEKSITGPAYGNDLNLDPLLVTTLLNDMSSLASWKEDGDRDGAQAEPASPDLSQADLIARRADQLPLMQHVLNWMWTLADARRSAPGEPIELTLEDYLAIGGLRGSLDRHADAVMRSTEDEALTSRIFRSLTDQPSAGGTSGSAEASAVRRRRTIAELAEETGASEDRVRAVMERFRAPGVSMITPDPSVELTSDTEVDITHESIIRQWGNLRTWIREEADSGRIWQELIRDAEKGEILRGLDLAERRSWWASALPDRGWAERYGGRYDEVEALIERSASAARRRRLTLLVGTAAVMALAILSGVSLISTQVAEARAAERLEELDAQRREAALEVRQAVERERRAGERAAAAEKLVTEARGQQRAAERAAAAAKLASAQAARQMQQVEVALNAAEMERARIQASSAQLAENVSRNLQLKIRQSRGQGPEQALGSFDEVNETAEVLQVSPSHYDAVVAEFAEAYTEHLLHRYELDELERVATGLQAAGRPGTDGEPAGVRTALLLGEALELRGEPASAVEQYSDAFDLASSSGSDPGQDLTIDALAGIAVNSFDSGDRERAGNAASACEQDAVSRSSDQDADASAREEALAADEATPAISDSELAFRIARSRCLAVSAALAPQEEGEQLWAQAARQLTDVPELMPVPRRLVIARSDLVTRALRTSGGTPDENTPDSITELILVMLQPYTDALTGEIATSSAGSLDLYPADMLARVKALNAFFRAILAEGDEMSPGDAGEVASFARIVDQLLLNLNFETEQLYDVPPALITQISDEYIQHARNRITALRFMAASSPETFRGEALQTATGLLDHNRLALPDAIAAERRSAILQLADGLVQVMSLGLAAEAYGSSDLRDTARELAASLCADETPQGSDSECDTLRNRAEALNASYQTRLASLRAEAAKSEPLDAVWRNSDGIALDGSDPVSCSSGVGSLFGAEPQNAADAVAEPDVAYDPGQVGNFCLFDKGSLRFAAGVGGTIWLFASEENRQLFLEDPAQYWPQFGGYDVQAAAEGDLDAPITHFGTIYRGKLYVSYLDRSVLGEDTIERAERSWSDGLRERARSAPPVASQSLEAESLEQRGPEQKAAGDRVRF